MLVGAFPESKSDFRFWRQIQIFPEISSIHANIFGFKSKSEKRATLCTAHFLQDQPQKERKALSGITKPLGLQQVWVVLK